MPNDGPSLPPKKFFFSRSGRSLFLSRFDLPHLLICFLIIAGFAALLTSSRMERLESLVLDYYFRRKPPAAAHPDLRLIEIDKESVGAIGAWPWPLEYHSKMIRVLTEWGAKAVIFETPFPYQNAKPGELEELRKAVEESGRVYFPVQLEPKLAKKIWIHAKPYELEAGGERLSWNKPPAEIQEKVKAVGHVNVQTDPDGIVRRISPFMGHDTEIYPYLALKAALEEQGGSLRSPLDLKLPLDASGTLIVNWLGRWASRFERLSYSEIVRIAQSGQAKPTEATALRNKICIIGVTDPALANFKATPLEPAAPSLAVFATVLDNAFSGRVLKPASFALNAFFLCMIGFIASIFFAVLRTVKSLIAGLALGGFWVLFTFLIFCFKGLWVFTLFPLLLIFALFIFSAIYNLTAAGKEQSRLFDLATRDGLTGLFVIRHFRDILNKVVEESQEKKEPLSVILIDVDNFKKINDTYGHPAGDMVLKKTAEVIHASFRTKRPIHQIDFAARYGGEEFIILVRRGTLKDSALNVAERIRKLVQGAVFIWDGVRIPVTISLGVACLHEGENVPDLMVRRADEALYRAKKAGKNQVYLETQFGS
jgi:diguanylate cyclase (GGDEF)-like protein